MCQRTAVLQPRHLPDSLGELNELHVEAVFNIFQELVDLLLHSYNSGLHWEAQHVLVMMPWYFIKELKVSCTLVDYSKMHPTSVCIGNDNYYQNYTMSQFQVGTYLGLGLHSLQE